MICIDPEQYCIIFPKGDTGLFTVNIFDSYVNEETDMAVFAVWRKNQINEQPLIKKVLPIIDGAVVILITEDDTKDIRGGDYNWDVMLFKRMNPYQMYFQKDIHYFLIHIKDYLLLEYWR